MAHIATMLFFALALIGAGSMIQLTLRDYRREILAALRHDSPISSAARPRPRIRAEHRPQVATARFAPTPRRAAL